MTSKQALLKLCFKYLPTIDEMHINLDEEDEELLKILVEDLEIAEIIKQKAKGNRFFKGCLLRMFQEDGEKKTYLDNPPRRIDKNYYKIKEWLENEK